MFVYTTVLLFFSGHRCVALKSLVAMYSTSKDNTSGAKVVAMGLGFLEDFVCTTYFASVLWVFDALKQAAITRSDSGNTKHKCVAIQRVWTLATFVTSWLLFFAMMTPFVADLLLVQLRDMRFTFDLITMAINERNYASAAPISSEEYTEGFMHMASLAIMATFFAIVHSQTRGAKVSTVRGVKYVELSLEEGSVSQISGSATTVRGFIYQNLSCFRRVQQAAVVCTGLVIVPTIIVAVSCSSSPLVAYSAMNATLNELFGHALQPSAKGPASFNLPPVETNIHPTEQYKRFGKNSLYRRTTGFHGDLAFDVNVTPENPPNVLVIGVESFRFQDSRYLVGDEDPSHLFKGTNMTVTPNFDRWAKRGVALRNMWSSNPTSRSLESMLFAQTPYYSTVKTGITGGRKDTKLAGVPQLFKAKGYETFFTTGCATDFENWNVFLPSHGFDTVWSKDDVAEWAEKDLGIKHDEWYGDEHRGFNWGVHDDINLQVLGDLLVNKTKEQRQRVADGEAKRPKFITHYTISSHAPFDARPTWYAESEKPDFSALYDGERYEKDIKNYVEIRYFTDMELGKFMDRMADAGVLNDTIVVIMGDHGQAPEADSIHLDELSVTRVAAAIVAEGRLGDAAGLVIEDAVQQYDILNTLADITGVPDEGFEQNGVGRSLKRKVRFGDRGVFSNVPGYKLSVVRGHLRLRFDGITDWMQLHNIETDHDMLLDLFPEQSPKDQAEWLAWRDEGRRISAYYTNRWDDNCFLAVNCD
ncbi:hypothetical protein PF005_g6782 [Phytophthora fragariae]|uniref:Sulfatase N-terminal domain-containing protein n=2 Tax=Phytophthora fragariae TaxID=53985 RepID=A0A6A3YP93_9STRA|nr:hypothetical protein PF005_g6782 [Phytophthora fragariae]